MRSEKPDKRSPEADRAGPAQLYALLAGALLSLLGILGFFFDASFGTGSSLASDDLAGTLNINGWRNVVYLATGLLGLALASRRPRMIAFVIGTFYVVLAIWGFEVTERGIGSILDLMPLGDNDNFLHLILGLLGLGAGLLDGPLPKLPKRFRPGRSRRTDSRAMKRSRAGRGARRRSPAGPRRAADDEPR